MKIFFYVLREYDERAFCEKYKKETGIDFDGSPEYPSLENADLARGCDAISFTPCRMTSELVHAFAERGVKYLCCRSIGYDHVNREAVQECGMRLSNISYPPNGVANYAIMLMMMCGRRIKPIMDRAAVQDFSLKGKIGRDISSSTVGVIGTGRIGTTVIRHLAGFGCRILAYDPKPNKEAQEAAEYVSLDTLYRESDFITLHANVTDEDIHMIDADALAEMKDGVILVNTSRGRLIDTKALIMALETGKVGAAGLDVLEEESGLYYYNRIGDVIVNHDMAILRSFPNVILSPHTAFYDEVNVEYMVRGIFESVDGFANGHPTKATIL